jgi:hypothetical protein
MVMRKALVEALGTFFLVLVIGQPIKGAQTTVYLGQPLRKWLAEYAKKLGVRDSAVVRSLLEKEQATETLDWLLSHPGPN